MPDPAAPNVAERHTADRMIELVRESLWATTMRAGRADLYEDLVRSVVRILREPRGGE